MSTVFYSLWSAEEQIEISKLETNALRWLADELIRARHVLGVGTGIRGRYEDVRLVLVRRYRVRARRAADRSADLEDGWRKGKNRFLI